MTGGKSVGKTFRAALAILAEEERTGLRCVVLCPTTRKRVEQLRADLALMEGPT